MNILLSDRYPLSTKNQASLMAVCKSSNQLVLGENFAAGVLYICLKKYFLSLNIIIQAAHYELHISNQLMKNCCKNI